MICQQCSAYAKHPLQAEGLLEAAHQYSPKAIIRSATSPTSQILLSRNASSEHALRADIGEVLQRSVKELQETAHLCVRSLAVLSLVHVLIKIIGPASIALL